VNAKFVVLVKYGRMWIKTGDLKSVDYHALTVGPNPPPNGSEYLEFGTLDIR
jgi:hypothetical protein